MFVLLLSVCLEPATEFEVITVLIFEYFGHMHPVDIAIIEAGMGGLYDSTNVFKALAVVCPSIGLDHQNVLGQTYAEIAAQKVGVLKEHVPFIFATEREDVRHVFVNKAQDCDSRLFEFSKDFYAQENENDFDYQGIKNVVGSFYPPSLVLIDPNTLNTLDKRQFNAGLVEAIKMATTCNKDLFEQIRNCKDINEIIDDVIYQALLIKKEVVENDEKEKGLRKILNFGHTIGHAIEASSSYLHGECVGLGMLYFASENVKQVLIPLLKKYDLPTSVNINKEKLLSFIVHDKKASGNSIDIILVDEIGSYQIKKVNVNDLSDYI